MMVGGESGPAITPGHASTSLLMQAVQYESLEMPPAGKLSQGQIADLAQWIEMEAPWPDDRSIAPPKHDKSGEVTTEDRNHWAFQPLREPVVPDGSSDLESKSPIDRFILARLAREGKHPCTSFLA